MCKTGSYEDVVISIIIIKIKWDIIYKFLKFLRVLYYYTSHEEHAQNAYIYLYIYVTATARHTLC